MLDYRWALGPGFGDLVISGGAGSGFGQSRASLATPSKHARTGSSSVIACLGSRFLLLPLELPALRLLVPLLFAMMGTLDVGVGVALRGLAFVGLSVEGGRGPPRLGDAVVLLCDYLVNDPLTGNFGGVGAGENGAERGVRVG